MSDAAKDKPQYNCFELRAANFTRVADCIQVEQELSRNEAERVADRYVICEYEKALIARKILCTSAIIIGGGIGICAAIKVASHLITGIPVTLNQLKPISFGVIACLNYYFGKPLFKMTSIANRPIRADDIGNEDVYMRAQKRINKKYPVKSSPAPVP